MHILLAIMLITHIVKKGDTLWGLVGNHYPVVCQENHIRNCNLIYPGERLQYPKEWEKNSVRTTGIIRGSDNDATASGGAYASDHLRGDLSCSGLERLWDDNGGRRSSAFIAAEIAMAESGGRQYATGAAGERGYWQINPDHGYLSTYDPNGNARAAIVISGNGSNWTPWTTYTHGLYVGRCLTTDYKHVVNALRTKAKDKAVGPEERDALNVKADEIEAKYLGKKGAFSLSDLPDYVAGSDKWFERRTSFVPVHYPLGNVSVRVYEFPDDWYSSADEWWNTDDWYSGAE